MLPSSPLSQQAGDSRSGSVSNSFSSSSVQQQNQIRAGANVTGDRELLWDRIRETDSLQSLLAAIEEAGFHSLVLSRSALLIEDVEDVNFGAILGKLGVFGTILDCKTVDDTVQRELSRLELDLVKLGVSKNSINLLCHHLEVARNVSKAVCLVIDDGAPPTTTAKSVFEPLEASRHHGLMNGGRLPAIIFGGGENGTVTRIEDRDSDASSSPSTSFDSEQQSTSSEAGAASGELLEIQHKLCSFTDMMLVAYESNIRAAV